MNTFDIESGADKTAIPFSDTDYLYTVGQTLQAEPRANQRDLAKAIGVSLGMTNVMLRRFIQRGWLSIRRLTPRKIQYLLTPEGMSALSHRSYRYFKRTVQSVSRYRDVITARILQAKAAGCTAVVMAGADDNDTAFIFSYVCHEAGLPFSSVTAFSPEAARADTKTFYILGAEFSAVADVAPAGHICTVMEIIGG